MRVQASSIERTKRRGVGDLVKGGTPIVGLTAYTAGQILVSEDVLGLFTQFKPRFVRRHAELTPLVAAAAGAYATDVRARRFPGPEHCFGRNLAPG